MRFMKSIPDATALTSEITNRARPADQAMVVHRILLQDDAAKKPALRRRPVVPCRLDDPFVTVVVVKVQGIETDAV